MNKYFCKLPFNDYYEPKFIKIIKNPKTQWIKYYNFDAVRVFPNIITKDPFYEWLYEEHTFTGGILRLPPNTVYNWHKDSMRGVCINHLIDYNLGESHCLFRDSEEVAHFFTELKYIRGARYLFNNQMDHMVVNLSETRYLFTIEFDEDKTKLSYDQLFNEIKENYEPIQKG